MLSLENEALDVVLAIDDAEIAKDEGVDTTINRLNKLWKKDCMITKYQALEVFQTFRQYQISSWLSFTKFFTKLNPMALFNQMIHQRADCSNQLIYQIITKSLIKPQCLSYNMTYQRSTQENVSNACRHVPTKNNTEDTLRTEDTFITGNFCQITI